MALEWQPDDAIAIKRKNKKQKQNDFVSDDEGKPTKPSKHGPLIGINWHRIVLDEAHSIRNKCVKSGALCNKSFDTSAGPLAFRAPCSSSRRPTAGVSLAHTCHRARLIASRSDGHSDLQRLLGRLLAVPL
jgi:hypothetical protein